MAIKTILFVIGFVIAAGGAIFLPMTGVLGYMLHYCLGPERQWWASSVNQLDIRYSYTLALATAVGCLLNWGKLRRDFSGAFLQKSEKIILVFLGLTWLTAQISAQTVGRYTTVDPPELKLTKVVIFIFLMSHIITSLKRYDYLVWALALGVLFLGLQAWDTPRSAFSGGRLNTIGGPDFSESNYLAAFLVVALPILGAQFLRTGWLGKLFILVSGAFGVNAVILTRSRGALLGAGIGGLIALFLSPPRYRLKIIVLMIALGIGWFLLTDPQYRQRMSTITRDDESRDTSAQSRVELWKASAKMLKDHPLGVGPGNFYQYIGHYNPALAGRDAHNAFVRCAAELGVQGIVVYVLIYLAAIRLMRQRIKQTKDYEASRWLKESLPAYGAAVSLFTLIGCNLTISLLYVEWPWWFLIIPVCLHRAAGNLARDENEAKLAESVRAEKPKKIMPKKKTALHRAPNS